MVSRSIVKLRRGRREALSSLNGGLMEKFPRELKCPICKSSEDKQYIFVALDGKIEETVPIHTDCILSLTLRYKGGILYGFAL